MIKRHIEYLRAKPEHVREKYALIYAVCITLIVVGVWFSSLSFTLDSNKQNLAKKEVVPGPLATAIAPIESSFKEVRAGWASVIQAFNIFK
ncbi:MAG: hypothetical protein WCO03_00935 [bacterium]